MAQTMAALLPAVKAGIQSGTILTLADIFTQCGIEGAKFQLPNDSETKVEKTWDWQRSLRWLSVGAFMHGPWFWWSFGKIEQFWGPSKSIGMVLTKTFTAQFLPFPVYMASLFTYQGILEGRRDPEQILENTKRKGVAAFLTGFVYWPPVNIFNFMFVPGSLRVPYLACAGGGWGAYLSWQNAH